jgi:hypothetical protein
MTPLASVAMLEKLALLKIARCNAPVLIRASASPPSESTSTASTMSVWIARVSSVPSCCDAADDERTLVSA